MTQAAHPSEYPAAPVRPPGRLAGWRNWNLPVKLGLVLLVPVLVVLALGVVVIRTEVTRATSYQRADRIVGLSVTLRSAITALQTERQDVAGADAGLAAAQAQTDHALAAATAGVNASAADGDLDPVASSAWAAARQQLAALPSLRASSGDAITAAADRSAQVGSYTELVDGLFAIDRVLATDLADASLARESMALYDLASAREEVLYQQSVVLAGIGNRTMSVADVTSLHGSEARLASRISDFHAVAAQSDDLDFSRSVTGPAQSQQSSLLDQAIEQSGGMSGIQMPGMMIEIPTDVWNAANASVVNGLDRVIGDLTGELQASATQMQQQADDTAGEAAVALVAALLAAIAVMAVISRQLLGSIGLLRRTARDVATRNLPDAVERIRAGENVDPRVTPVPVHTNDEVGQLARAFDAVHAEALKLAVEQANLRANYSELFVNLSRRSQSLVQRQLRLIEQLERDEEDPDQLSSLFKLDHLATRMRRNNENLMVLSGTEPHGRGPAQPVSLADLLRAAVSEIEHYERVIVQPPPDIQVIGYAAGDLVRLIAELLDNATAFSAPESQVTLASHRTRSRSIVVDIVDHGIGMTDDELNRANEQLTQPEGVEERVSRRMGMFVVSKLANRHGVRVRLHGGQDIPGLRVTVTLPLELILGDVEDLLPSQRNGRPDAPRPGGDPVSGALTVTIPKLPSAASSGVDLFGPLSDEDVAEYLGHGANGHPVTGVNGTNGVNGHSRNGTNGHGVNGYGVNGVNGHGVSGHGLTLDEDGIPTFTPPKPPEVTPIFDDVLSAWFDGTPVPPPETTAATPNGGTEGTDSIAAEPAEPPATPAPDRPDGWRFAADDGWRAVDAAAAIAPEEVASAGLPKRQPRARLLPGSVDLGDVEPGPRPLSSTRLNPERARARLSGFQRGARAGREAASELAGLPEPGWPTMEHTAILDMPAEFAADAETGPATATPAAAGEVDRPVETGPSDAEPSFASPADEGWRSVAPDRLGAEPTEVTAAGLPKRQPRSRLAPGSVAGKAKAAPDRPDAGALRERLSSFQHGIKQGRPGATPEHAVRTNTKNWEKE